MKNKFFEYIKYFAILIISVFLIFTLSACGEQDKTKEKVGEEIKFMENKLISVINGLNNIKLTNYVLAEKNFKDEKQGNESSEGENKSGTQKSGSESAQSSEQGGQGESGSSGQGGGSTDSGGSSSGGTTGGNSSSSSTQGSSTNSSGIQYEMKESGILDNNQAVDWEATKNEIENLYSIWSSMIVDLHTVNVNNEDILNFSSQLDDLIVNVQKEDKVNTAAMLANLYSYIPRYVEHYTEDSTKINLSYAKSYIISSYAYIQQDNWNEAKLKVTKAQEHFSNIINNANEKNMEKQNKFSKVYVLLGEFNNSIDKKDKQLYYIKYKKLMENIEDIETNENR